MKKKFKVRKKWKVSDIHPDDLLLLGKASGLVEKEFLTFGKSYDKLRSLDLITDECQLSWYGKKFLKYLQELN